MKQRRVCDTEGCDTPPQFEAVWHNNIRQRLCEPHALAAIAKQDKPYRMTKAPFPRPRVRWKKDQQVLFPE